jgi:hypothetical protein
MRPNKGFTQKINGIVSTFGYSLSLRIHSKNKTPSKAVQTPRGGVLRTKKSARMELEISRISEQGVNSKPLSLSIHPAIYRRE